MAERERILQYLYDRFNARDMEAVLANLDQAVVWANGMEGGHVHGRDGVRAYWTRQWASFQPRVEPLSFSTGAAGEVAVEVHQVVRDLDGKLLVDEMVGHIFGFDNDLVIRFDIRGAAASSGG